MVAQPFQFRKPLAFWLAVLLLTGLAACAPVGPAGGPGPAPATGVSVPVALLVPGGAGDDGNRVLARSLENAARMAADDLSGAEIDLRVYDTAADAARAGEVARLAVDEGARVILGPVYSKSAVAAAEAVADDSINVLSFSNNTTIAGDNLFVLGRTFGNVARRLVGFAAGQGLERIAIVRDPNESGRLGATAIRRAAAVSGGAIVAESRYEFSQQGVVEAAPRIAETVRAAGADALFLTADSAGALPLLAQLLPENGLSPEEVRYIGLARWDVPASTLDLAALQGGWFALPDPDLTARFRARYEGRFGTPPHPIAALAYDGVAAIGALAATDGAGAATARAGLTQPSGFAGVGGVFRLLPDGTNRRALAVAEVQDGAAVVISPAPRSLGGSAGL